MKLPELLERLPLPGRARDPFEDFYLRTPPADARNLIVNRIREAPEGSIFAVKTETHTPEVMARHVKELGRFFGADLSRIADARQVRQRLGVDSTQAADLPFAVLLAFRARHDPRDAPGVGGHATALKGAFATFQVGAIIREFGFQATTDHGLEAERVAAACGLGTLDANGRLKAPRFGTRVYVADVILTDLPLAADA